MPRRAHGSMRRTATSVVAAIWRWRVVVLAAVVMALTPGAGAQVPTTRPGKTLLMHYMPWYQTPQVRGAWGGHWAGFDRKHKPDQQDGNGRPDIWSNYHPLIGLYDSTDPTALECQLLQMKLAGVDGIIVDWYGISDAADYPMIQEGTQAVFDATARFGMSFAACFEDRTYRTMVDQGKIAAEQVPAHLAKTMQWMQEQWFGRPNYYRLNGRPLLLNFGPEYVTEAAAWDGALRSVQPRPKYFAMLHLWKEVGADGAFTWVHTEPWNEGERNAQTIRRRLGEVFRSAGNDPNRVIVSACPGFDDVYPQHYPRLEHRDGQTLRESLEVGMEGPWPIIQLVTWNDYGEGTMIEPTQEFGYTFLEIVQAERKRERGEAFRYVASDLRLPGRLYALRKGGRASAERLDQISRMLNEGKCEQAGIAMDGQGN